jgi:hypothetical protein
VRGIGGIQIEKAVFTERRDSWRPNLLAVGAAILHLAAGRFEGNWIRGAARGVDSMAAWDSAEGARFTDRFQPAVIEVSTALVQLSLMSPGLQRAAGQVYDPLAAVMKARRKPDAAAAAEQLTEAVAVLRGSVTEFTARKRGVCAGAVRRVQTPARSAAVANGAQWPITGAAQGRCAPATAVAPHSPSASSPLLQRLALTSDRKTARWGEQPPRASLNA